MQSRIQPTDLHEKGDAMSSQHEVQEWVRRRLAQEAWMRDLEDDDEAEATPASPLEHRRAS